MTRRINETVAVKVTPEFKEALEAWGYEHGLTAGQSLRALAQLALEQRLGGQPFRAALESARANLVQAISERSKAAFESVLRDLEI